MTEAHERVVLRTAKLADELKIGDVGIMVHIYQERLAYEVEFTTPGGDTAALVTAKGSQVWALQENFVRKIGEFALTLPGYFVSSIFLT